MTIYLLRVACLQFLNARILYKECVFSDELRNVINHIVHSSSRFEKLECGHDIHMRFIGIAFK